MMIRLLAVSLAYFSVASAQGEKYEALPVLAANKIFPGVPLKGEYYQVLPDVTTDGFLTRTVINSGFGEFAAVGPGMLDIRLNEIEALSSLETFESSEEFQHGAKESVSDKTEGLKKLIDNPKETAQGIGEGVGRFFKRAARATKTGVQKAGDILNEKTPGALDESGAGANLPGASQAADSANSVNKYAQVAGASGRVALNILGFDDARRKLAKRLAVDPYTTNPVLDKRLDEVTQSIFAGDLAVDIATALIPGGTLVSASNVATDWVWDTPPGDLRVEIEQSLIAIGVSKENVDRFLRHQWYPLTYQALLTQSLESLEGVEGRVDIFPLVLTVTSFDQGRFVVNSLRMSAQYHESVRPINALTVHGTLVARDDSGAMVVTAPVDYMSWVEPLDAFTAQEVFSNRNKIMYITGAMTAKARNNLQKRGWETHEKSDLLVLLSQ